MVVFAVASCAVAVYGDFKVLVMVSAIARLLFSVTTCLAVAVLRHKMPDASRKFKLPFGPLIPMLAAIISIWLLAGIDRWQAIAGAVALVTGAILYLIFREK